MRRAFFSLLTCLALSAAASAQEAGWISLFNGKDLTGWKSNEKGEGLTGIFTVEDGMIKASGGRAHMFYMGPDGNASFKNFELKAKFMTKPGSNSGIYFHTVFQEKNWPDKGFECQVNATHKDHIKTGSLYHVVNVMDNAPNKDNVWSEYDIKVEGKHVILKVDGQTTVDWVQPDDWKSPKGHKDRVLDKGTFALQAHDPNSTTYFKDIYLKVLP